MGASHRLKPRGGIQASVAGGCRLGDRLLGQHIQRQGGDAHLLNAACDHVGGGHDCSRQLPAVQGIDGASGRRTHLVTRPTDPLQRTGGRWGSPDLDHLLHRAHVDAQLQGARGDDGAQPAALQGRLDLGPHLLAD